MRTKKILNFECETKEVVVYYPTRIACSHEGHAKKAPLFIFLIIIFRFLMLFFPLLCLSLGNGRKSNDFKQKLMGKWCFPRRSQNIAGPVIFSVFLWSPSAAKVNLSREKVLDSGVDLETAGPWFDSPPRRFFSRLNVPNFCGNRRISTNITDWSVLWYFGREIFFFYCCFVAFNKSDPDEREFLPGESSQRRGGFQNYRCAARFPKKAIFFMLKVSNLFAAVDEFKKIKLIDVFDNIFMV